MIQFANQGTGQRYDELQAQIDRQFSAGRFVAIEGGQVVLDAESHAQLVEKLRSSGKSAKGIVILEAGAQYPASAVIFSR